MYYSKQMCAPRKLPLDQQRYIFLTSSLSKKMSPDSADRNTNWSGGGDVRKLMSASTRRSANKLPKKISNLVNYYTH